MVVEMFAGDIAAGLIEAASNTGQVVTERVRNFAYNNQMDAHAQGKFEGYREGCNWANGLWQRNINHVIEEVRDRADKALYDSAKAESESRENREVYEKLREQYRSLLKDYIYLDCQRFGYMKVIGMLAKMWDSPKNEVIDNDGNVYTEGEVFLPTGESHPAYLAPYPNHKYDGRDLPGVNDIQHKRAYRRKLNENEIVLNMYEHCFMTGFRKRAAQIWEEAERRNDTFMMETLESQRTLSNSCFIQKYWDAVELEKIYQDGRKHGTAMVKFWEDYNQYTFDYWKEHHLSERDIDKLTSDYNKFVDEHAKDIIKEHTDNKTMFFV